jgi:hypothetical protein
VKPSEAKAVDFRMKIGCFSSFPCAWFETFAFQANGFSTDSGVELPPPI